MVSLPRLLIYLVWMWSLLHKRSGTPFASFFLGTVLLDTFSIFTSVSVSLIFTPLWGHDIFPSRASPLSEGELAAHVPHHQALEAPLDDVLSEQRAIPPHPPRSGPQDDVISSALSMSALPP